MKTHLCLLPVVLTLSCGALPTALAQTGFTLEPPVSTNLVGETITLALVGPPDDEPFAFQWKKDGVVIEGADQPSLSIANAQLDDTGSYTLSFYHLVVEEPVELVLTAIVYVVDQPQIYEPVHMSVSGSSVSFAVDATGGLLSYQWTWQGYDIPGATGSVLTFADGYANASAGYYAVRVSNPAGTVSSSPTGLLFTKPAPSGTYQGIFFNEAEAAVESTGWFRYTISSSKRSFSGLLTLGKSRYRFSGLFSEAHEAETGLTLRSGERLSAYMQLITTNDSPIVTGWVQGASWTAPLRGHRLYFSSKNPTPLVGSYTLALQNTNTHPNFPNGHAYGAVRIRKDGTVTISGKAADGSSFSRSCGLSRQGDWPFYASLNRQRGRLVGWLKVQPQSGSSIRGTSVFWLKDPGPDKRYPGGFKLALQPTGSTYIKPADSSQSVLALTTGIATLYGGGMFSGESAIYDFIKVYLTPPTKFTAEPSYEKLRLNVSKSTGVIKGSFKNISTGKKESIRGVVLQQQNAGAGYFLGRTLSGGFTLAPATPPGS